MITKVKLSWIIKKIRYGSSRPPYCSSKPTVLLELHSRKAVHFSKQIMSADKYLRIFSCQMKAIVYLYLHNNCLSCSLSLKSHLILLIPHSNRTSVSLERDFVTSFLSLADDICRNRIINTQVNNGRRKSGVWKNWNK